MSPPKRKAIKAEPAEAEKPGVSEQISPVSSAVSSPPASPKRGKRIKMEVRNQDHPILSSSASTEVAGSKSGQRRAYAHWTAQEEAAVYRALCDLGLKNTSQITADAGLTGVRDVGMVRYKIKALRKKYEGA
ncbi:hypothetical protein CBOM_03859 [Ceraceosorus bombacis]|uniref:Uncharacterized protein n=1 Tax=Ceraceosorus bombacis TaxID=401625 RepID=A0A0P1BI99_9BASI|nr:hypothetical protein CBOM_03859 [Ceraceosorus bombacis]